MDWGATADSIYHQLSRGCQEENCGDPHHPLFRGYLASVSVQRLFVGLHVEHGFVWLRVVALGALLQRQLNLGEQNGWPAEMENHVGQESPRSTEALDGPLYPMLHIS